MPNYLKAIIVDDEEQNIAVLSKMIFQFCTRVEIVANAKSVSEAKEKIDQYKPDIIFLDIELSGENAFDLLDSFEDIHFHIIFTTAHADYAIKAIKVAALDYLLKPISVIELRASVENAKKVVASKKSSTYLGKTKENQSLPNGRIAIPSIDGYEIFSYKDIIYVEADRAYCNFHFSDHRKIVVSKSMSEFEINLEANNFIRVHKSSMVNLSHVTKYVRGNGGFLVMSDGSNIAVAVRKKEFVLSKIG